MYTLQTTHATEHDKIKTWFITSLYSLQGFNGHFHSESELDICPIYVRTQAVE